MNSFHRITELCVLHVAKALHPLFLNNTTDLSLSVSFSFTVTQYLTFSSPRSVFFPGNPLLLLFLFLPLCYCYSSVISWRESWLQFLLWNYTERCPIMFLCSSFCLRQLLCNSAEHVMKTTSDWVIASCYGIYFYWLLVVHLQNTVTCAFFGIITAGGAVLFFWSCSCCKFLPHSLSQSGLCPVYAQPVTAKRGATVSFSAVASVT